MIDMPAAMASQPVRPVRRQRGAALIELAAMLTVLISSTAFMLQIGRGLLAVNVATSTAYSMTMHMATAPDAEIKSSPSASNTAKQIGLRMEKGAAIDNSVEKFQIGIGCQVVGNIVCGGSTLPTRVNVSVRYDLYDKLYEIYTRDPPMLLDKFELIYLARFPRVGFM
jgi:hypothetical protein